MADEQDSILEFDASTPFGFSVRCTRRYWRMIVEWKHPVLVGKTADVVRVFEFPDQIRRSRKDPAVLLFYRRYERRWLCGVVRITSSGSFVVTAYPTDALKAGEILWTAFE